MGQANQKEQEKKGVLLLARVYIISFMHAKSESRVTC